MSNTLTSKSIDAPNFECERDQHYYNSTCRFLPFYKLDYLVTHPEVLDAMNFAYDQARLTADTEEATQLRQEADYIQDLLSELR